jgi:hypothetical protein
MPDYTKSKIYKIIANTEDEYRPYIGSTTREYLSQRLVQHRGHYNCYKNGKGALVASFKLFDKYGIENCEIVLIENYPCATKDELRARERYWFDTIENCNICKPAIFESDINENYKKRYQKQLELDPDANKKHYQRKLELDPECNKKQHQRRLELHLDYHKIKNERYNCKKEILKNKYTCECGSNIRATDKPRHNKSKKHLDYIATIAIQQEV